MAKKILICTMCLILLLGIGVSAENNVSSSAESSTAQEQFEMPKGTPPEGMELPEGAEPPNMDFGGGNMPEGFNFGGMQAEAEPVTFMSFVKEYQTPIISVILLLAAFVFVKLYKRKNY